DRLDGRFNTKLSVSADIADEIVVVNAHDVDYFRLLEKIADAVHAKWTSSPPNQMRLERPAKTARQLRESSLAMRAKEINDYLATFDEALAQPFTAQGAVTLRRQLIDLNAKLEDDRMNFALDRALDAEYAKGPAARLAIRLLKTVDPELLTGLEYAERRVFNLTPTALQHKFGDGAKEAFEKYVEEQNVWAAVSQGGRSRSMMSLNPFSHQEPVSEPPYELSIELQTGDISNMLFANLIGWDLNGVRRYYYQVMPMSPGLAAFVPFRRTEYDLPEWLTGLDREIFEAFAAIFGGKRTELSDEASEFLKKPTEGDIGGRMAASVLSRRYEGRDLVALVPDRDSYRMVYMLSVIEDHRLFDDLLDRGLGWSVTEDDGWVTVQPKDVHMAWYRRTPRKSLEQYIASVVNKGRTTFEDYTAFVARLRWPSDLDQTHTRLLGLPLNRLPSGREEWHLLRLYGLMTQAQKLGLAQGGSLAYSSLSRDQRQAYLRVALSSQIDSRTYLGEDGTSGYRPVQGMTEPTEVLVNGIPPDATLSISAKGLQAVYAYSKIGERLAPYQAMSPLTVAHYIKRQRDPSLRYPGETIMDAWAMGQQMRYEFRLQYVTDRWHLFRIFEDVPDPDASPGPWEQLPADVVDKIKIYLRGSLRP
ncbi:MAG: hypothetical protein IH945_12205, partial [Armatimonadetes bacterium]|nr:hypothetical protein [Armatimonadota bacterium]